MTAMIVGPEVERARAELREHVDDLTSISHHQLTLDDGDVINATTPPLLDQVDAEIAGNAGNAGGPNWRSSKEPLWLDGSVLLAEVDEHTGRWDGDTRTERVRAWGAWVASNGTPDGIVEAAGLAGRWAAACRTLLDPPPRMLLRGQRCPECGAEKVWDREDTAAEEHHAKPALGIDPHRGVCVCAACHAEWPHEHWELLVQVLELQRQERAQANGYDTTVRARRDDERWDSHRA